jgi:hypothetical protein
VRRRYADEARSRGRDFERALRGESVDHVDIDTSVPYLPALIQLFKQRSGGRR